MVLKQANTGWDWVRTILSDIEQRLSPVAELVFKCVAKLVFVSC